MKLFSKGGYILTAAVLFSSVAWANQLVSDKTANESLPVAVSGNSKTYTATGSTDIKTAQMLVNLLRNPQLEVKAEVGTSAKDRVNFPKKPNDPTYTAHGIVDQKTALLLVNLLKNPHLKVKAEVHNKAVGNRVKTTDTSATYRISGRTDLKTVKKLKKLLENNKQVEINISSNNGVNLSGISLTGSARPSMQQYLYQDYSTITSNGKTFYHNGRPPVFIQGNTLWYPVAVTSQQAK